MPDSRFTLHGLAPSLIHGLRTFFASNSRFRHLFQAPLDTPLDSPFSATLSVHGLHFTVCAPSNSRVSPDDYGDVLRPARRHCTVMQLLRRTWSRNKEGDVALGDGRVSRQPCGPTLYLSERCGIPTPLPLTPDLVSNDGSLLVSCLNRK